MSPAVDSGFAAVFGRRRQSHREELSRLVRHRSDWRDKLVGLERKVEALISVAEDPAAPGLHQARAADMVLTLDPVLDDTRAYYESVARELDCSLERFHAGEHPPDPLPLMAEACDGVANLSSGLRAERLRAQAALIRSAARPVRCGRARGGAVVAHAEERVRVGSYLARHELYVVVLRRGNAVPWLEQDAEHHGALS